LVSHSFPTRRSSDLIEMRETWEQSAYARGFNASADNKSS